MAVLGTHERGSNFRWWLGGIAAAALLLRVAVVLVWRDRLVLGDGWGYHYQALLNANGTWFVNPVSLKKVALHPPGWPLVLTVVSWLHLRSWTTQELLCAVLGTATVVVTGLAGRRLAGARAGLIAAGIAAVWSGFWLWERALLSETLTLLLVASIILATYRLRDRLSYGRAIALGALLGLMVLTRSDEALAVVILVVPIVWVGLRARDRAARRHRMGIAATVLAVVALCCLPWTLYNHGRFHHTVLLSTGMGNIVGGSYCPRTFSGPQLGSFDQACATYRLTGHKGDQSDQDVYLRHAAWEYATSHLGRLPIVVLAREGRAFSLYSAFQENQREATLQNAPLIFFRLDTVGLWVLAIPAVAGAVILRRRRVPIYPLMAFVVVVVLATGLTEGQARYRAAANVPIALFAAVAIDALIGRLRSRSATAAATSSPDERAVVDV
jgi:4-amino-4-deoxy-L-arabinose transferase-like glycosyltransferase